MKDLTIDYKRNKFPAIGNGIAFTEDIFGIKFSAEDVASTSNLIWQPNATLPISSAKELPGDYAIISDIAKQMTVQSQGSLLAKRQLNKVVAELPPQLFEKFKLDVIQHLQNPTTASAQLIADIRLWCSWLANGIKIEPLLHKEIKAQSTIAFPLSALLLLASKLLGQQPEFEYASDYVLRSGILPATTIDNCATDTQIIDYIRAIKPVVAFNDFDGNEQGFRMTHLAMEQCLTQILTCVDAIINDCDLLANLEQITEQLHLSNRIFNCMWKVSKPEHYNTEVRIYIQGLYGNQGGIYDSKGLCFQQCANNSDLFVQNLHGQTGANSSFHPLIDEVTGIGDLTKAYQYNRDIDPHIIKAVLTKGFVASKDLEKLAAIDDLAKLLKSFRVGYRPPAHHQLIIDTKYKVQQYNFLEKIIANKTATKYLTKAVFYQIKHRLDHYKMVASYILNAPNPYDKQKKAIGTGGSPTPSFLPNMFRCSLDRFQQLIDRQQLQTDSEFNQKYIEPVAQYKILMQQLVELAKRH